MKTHSRPEPSRERRLSDRSRDGNAQRIVSREPGRKAGAVPAQPRSRKPHKAEGRNLRLDYNLTLMGALLFSLLVLTGLFRAPILPGDGAFDITLDEQEVVQMEEMQQTEQVQKPPPPPRPPVPVEVPNDEILVDEDLDLDASLDLNAPVSELPPPPPAPVIDRQEEEDAEIFVVVEQMPEIIGGPQKVYEYLVYPPIARQAGMEGLVVVQIVVNREGRPTDPFMARSAGEVLDQAARDAVMQLRFTPGRQRGKAVPVRLAIPIRFRLKDADR